MNQTDSSPEAAGFTFIECAGIHVAHHDTLDGGGPRTWPGYVEQVRNRIGPVNHAFEWCAGPGYIGFALLGAGLCQKLALADVNKEAVRACRETIKRNNLDDRVRVYHSDGLRDIPKHEKWDLVVGDPPHFPAALNRHIENGFVLRSVDEDWALHKRFFAELPEHTHPGTHLLITESRVAGDHDDLIAGMIERAGFKMQGPSIEYPERTRYFLHAVRTDA